MELKVTALDGQKRGSVTLSDAIFGLEPRDRPLHLCVLWQLANGRRVRMRPRTEDIPRTGKKMYGRKSSARARHGSARVNLFRGGGRSFARIRVVTRWPAEKGTRAGAQACALGKGQGWRPRRDRGASLKEAKTKALRGHSDKLGVSQRADHRRCRGCGRGYAPRHAIFRISTCSRWPASTSTISCSVESSC